MDKNSRSHNSIWLFIKNHQQWLGFLVVVVAVLYAYFTVIFEPRETFLDIAYAIFFLLLLLGLYRAFRIERQSVKTIRFLSWESLVVMIGVISTYSLIHYAGVPAVIASSFFGLVGYLLIRKFEIALYCGSFAGMVSGAMFNISEVLLLSLICAFIYLLTKPLFSGYGGKLGTIAFLSSLITFGIFGEEYLVVESDFHFITLLTVSVIGVVTTYLLHHKLRMSSVLSSAMPSFVFAIIVTYLFPTYIEYGVVFFSASFIGMSDDERLPNWICVILSGLILGMIYFIFVSYFHGLGGKLGLMALMSVIITSGISAIINRRFIKNKYDKEEEKQT